MSAEPPTTIGRLVVHVPDETGQVSFRSMLASTTFTADVLAGAYTGQGPDPSKIPLLPS